MKERLLDSSPLFSVLLAKERLLLSRRMGTQKFSPGEEIFAQGVLSEALYLIESGWVRLTREEKGEGFRVATLGSGNLLGEEELLLERPYPVSARAVSEVVVFMLSKGDFLAIVREEPQIGVKLSLALDSLVAGVTEYLMEDRLAKTPLFSLLPTDLLSDIARRLRPKRYRRGKKICRAGEPGEAIYIVDSGRIEALPGVEGEEVSSLGEGGLFGEVAVLTGRGCGTTYRAATQVILWALSGEEFGRLTQAHPLLRRVAGEHLRAKLFGLPVAVEPVETPRIRLSLPARPVSLGQGVGTLVAAFGDLLRWQAQQGRAVRIQLGVVVFLLIWLCGVSAPTAVISSITGGEGMVALLAAPTPTFTPSPMPTDTPTLPPSTPTPTHTPVPTDTPTPPPTPTPTEVPTETPTPKPTATPGTAAVPATPTPTPTPSPVPVTVAVYDKDRNPKDMGWATARYGVWIEKAVPAPDGSVYRIVELRERTGTNNFDVWVKDGAGVPRLGISVRCWFPEGEDRKPTDPEGRAGICPMGPGSYQKEWGQCGAYSIQVDAGIPSDIGRCFGMIGKTDHWHLDTVFQLVRQ